VWFRRALWWINRKDQQSSLACTEYPLERARDDSRCVHTPSSSSPIVSFLRCARVHAHVDTTICIHVELWSAATVVRDHLCDHCRRCHCAPSFTLTTHKHKRSPCREEPRKRSNDFLVDLFSQCCSDCHQLRRGRIPFSIKKRSKTLKGRGRRFRAFAIQCDGATMPKGSVEEA
jgi:hypothetical protein